MIRRCCFPACDGWPRGVPRRGALFMPKRKSARKGTALGHSAAGAPLDVATLALGRSSIDFFLGLPGGCYPLHLGDFGWPFQAT